MIRPSPLDAVRNILILRTDHLGDLLLSTPLIRTLRTALPGRRFTLVVSPANAGALDNWDAIDEILLYDPRWSLAKKWRFARQLATGCGGRPWDLCLVLSPRTPSYLLGWLSKATLRAGIVYSRRLLARLMSPFWLTHPVVMAVDEQLADHQPVLHEVRQLAAIAAALGLPANEPGPLEIPLAATDIAWSESWLADHEGPTLGVHGAGKWLSQGWTAEDFLQLLQTLAAPQRRLVVTFGPGDRLLEQAVTEALAARPDPRILLPGPLSIPRWAALFSCCDLVISPDTGSLHLAVAVGRPVVAMYEAASFLHCSSQWAPWGTSHAMVRRTSPMATIPILLAEVLRLLAAAEPKDREAESE